MISYQYSRPSAPESWSGIEVLCNRKRELGERTLHDISVALQSMEGLFEGSGKVELFSVAQDSGRDEEEKAQSKVVERMTGPETGISPTLVYKDEEENRGRCVVQ